jgi:4-hydroxy-tetrahydrodipicolinate reductase
MTARLHRRLSCHARIVKSGNMSDRASICFPSWCARQQRRWNAADWDIEVLEMHHRHKVDAPSGTALCSARRRPKDREITLSDNSVRVRDGHTGAARGRQHRICHPARRFGDRRSLGDSCRSRRNGRRCHHAIDRSIFARGAVRAALWATGREARPLFHADVLGLADH